jgi:hypothetical protein
MPGEVVSAPCLVCGGVLVDAIGGCARCYANTHHADIPSSVWNTANSTAFNAKPISFQAMQDAINRIREREQRPTPAPGYRWQPVMDDRVRPDHRRAEPTKRPPVYVRPGTPAARSKRFVSDRAAYLAQLRAQKPVAVARMESR